MVKDLLSFVCGELMAGAAMYVLDGEIQMESRFLRCTVVVAKAARVWSWSKRRHGTERVCGWCEVKLKE